MVNTVAATVISAIALSAVPLLAVPAAHADVCGSFGGRHVSVGGCTPGIAGDAIAGAAVAGTAEALNHYGYPPNYAVSPVPSFPGEAPCISPTGLPYYTPAGMPCY